MTTDYKKMAAVMAVAKAKIDEGEINSAKEVASLAKFVAVKLEVSFKEGIDIVSAIVQDRMEQTRILVNEMERVEL